MNTKTGLYTSDDKIILSPFDTSYVCKKLKDINFLDLNHDYFGEAMEVFRSHWAKSHGGQFFTDQRVTKLAMTLLSFNPLNGDDLVDICAGTGGFLLAGINHIRELVLKSNGSNYEAKISKLAAKSILGREIDADVSNIANSTLSSRLGKKGLKLVSSGNSLLSSFDNSSINFNTHLCVATNPPFGTKITIKDPEILSNFELAHSKSSTTDQISLLNSYGKIVPRAPDILFLEQNIKLLKPGKGRLAIVVPFQMVSGPQSAFIREWLLKKVQVLAVVDLPSETFQPYTGTKTSLLLLKRRDAPLKDIILENDPDIFMAIPKWIGHDRRGIPMFKRLIDGTVTDEILSDFAEIEASYNSFIEGKNPSETYDKCFVTLANKISSISDYRLDAHYYYTHSKNHQSTQAHTLLNKQKWEYIPIKKLIKRIFYPGRFTRHYVEDKNNSVPFLGGTNITQLILNTEKRLSLNNPKLDELKVEQGWILITRSGSTGIVSSVPKAWDGFAISEHVIRIIPDESKIPGEYLYAILKSSYGQQKLSQGIYGSVIDEITPEFIGNIEIPIPKSNKTLTEIKDLIKNGEVSRQNAIQSLTEGVNKIEEIFSV